MAFRLERYTVLMIKQVNSHIVVITLILGPLGQTDDADESIH